MFGRKWSEIARSACDMGCNIMPPGSAASFLLLYSPTDASKHMWFMDLMAVPTFNDSIADGFFSDAVSSG